MPPQIILELNGNLGSSGTTVESITEKGGISKKPFMDGWVKHVVEFLDALKIIKEVQDDDPFKSDDEEDIRVNAIIMTLLLMETKDRHYALQNQ
jgi:hypothetical protein